VEKGGKRLSCVSSLSSSVLKYVLGSFMLFCDITAASVYCHSIIWLPFFSLICCSCLSVEKESRWMSRLSLLSSALKPPFKISLRGSYEYTASAFQSMSPPRCLIRRGQSIKWH
jgi:hypothetical protein